MEHEPTQGRPEPTTYNLLFVCTGNTCRSPMAAAIARTAIERRGWRHVAVASAGVAAQGGGPASPQTIAALQRRGIDAGEHRARHLTPEQVDWADLVLVMTPSQRSVVEELGGGHKVALLGDFFAGHEGAGEPVPDPFGGDQHIYDETLRELERLVEGSLDRLVAIVRP